MKKLFIVLAVAGALTACNNSADNTAEKKDSIDSVTSERKEAIDSTADQRKEAVDSTAEQKKETLDKMDSLNKKDTTKK
jgi:hypothetical protein